MGKVFVYVIVSEEGYRYTGVTENLQRRIEEHNTGSVSFWTKRGKNWRLVHTEEHASRPEAMKRESWLKSGVGREFLDHLLGKQ